MRSARLALLALLGLAPLAIAVRQATVSDSLGSPAPAAALDWSELSSAGFTAFAQRFAGAGARATRDEQDELIRVALSGEGEIPTRATVLLGLVAASDGPGASPRARTGLLLVLSARAPVEGRENVGRTIVAARALRGAAAEDAGLRDDLLALVSGETRHPDLPTRVECAYTLCEAGAAREVLPFLLSVLRAETPDQAKSPRTWERITTLAWVKTRAAEALTRAARTELRFHPDASWAAQMQEANRLEALLR
ncbi:MAG: hypothetical protein AAFU73_20275 [Planctomycetota bacterium]